MENYENPDRTGITSIAGRNRRGACLTLVKNLALAGLLGATALGAQGASVFDVVPNSYVNSPGLGYSAALSQPIRSQQLYPSNEFPAATVRITALRWRRYSAQTISSASGQFRFKLSTTTKSENNLSSTFAQNVGLNETIVFDGTWNVSSPTPDNVAPYPFELVLNLTTPFDYNPAQGNLLLEHQCFSTSIPFVDAAGDAGDGLARAYNLNLDPNGTTASVVDTGGEIIQFEYTIIGPTLTHVVPIGLESTEGNYYSGTMREPLLRQQTLYAAANFPSSTLHITELRFRRDISEPPFVNASATATVKLSTTSRGTGNMSSTFANNSGPDETTVFNGVWNYSTPTVVGAGIVRPFEIVLPLATPFTYNPASGNLLFDIRITGGTGGSWTDGASGGPSQVARVLSLNPNATTGNVGELTGDVIQFVYQAQPVTTITITPPAGTFTNSVQVSIQSGYPNSYVRYTTDGNDPTQTSTTYTGPFTLTQTRTVKARLFVNGFPASEIAEATYTRYVPPDIQFIPAGRLFTNQLGVTLVNNVGGGTTIRYTLNGSAPTSTSTAYAGPINLTAAATIRAQVYLGNFFVSDVFTESYARVYAFANDGVPFAWREQYFGPGFLTNPCAAADADCDDDGYVVAEEYQYSTDPTDGDSAPEIILTVRAVPRLTFTTIPGRSYRIQRTTTLNPPAWQTIVESVTAIGPQMHYVDEEAPNTSYYQVELIRD